MYGQRELLDSNLLAWIYEELTDVGDAIFRDFTDDNPGSECQEGQFSR